MSSKKYKCVPLYQQANCCSFFLEQYSNILCVLWMKVFDSTRERGGGGRGGEGMGFQKFKFHCMVIAQSIIVPIWNNNSWQFLLKSKPLVTQCLHMRFMLNTHKEKNGAYSYSRCLSGRVKNPNVFNVASRPWVYSRIFYVIQRKRYKFVYFIFYFLPLSAIFFTFLSKVSKISSVSSVICFSLAEVKVGVNVPRTLFHLSSFANAMLTCSGCM